jgi:hypothetical protein
MEIPPSTAIGYAESRLRSKSDNRFSSRVAALNRNADYAVRAKGEATLLAKNGEAQSLSLRVKDDSHVFFNSSHVFFNSPA